MYGIPEGKSVVYCTHVISMGSKKKTSRVFGKGKGVHQKCRKEKHHGRPRYILKTSRTSGKNIKIKIQKLWKKHSIGTGRKVQYISTILSDNHTIRLSIKKVKHVCPEGYRLINLATLQTHVNEVTLHACQCVHAIALASTGKSPITVLTETRNLGLASVFAVQCNGCKKHFKFETSPRIPGSRRYTQALIILEKDLFDNLIYKFINIFHYYDYLCLDCVKMKIIS